MNYQFGPWEEYERTCDLCKTARSDNLITNIEKLTRFKKIKIKMERHENKTYFLFAYHHFVTIVLQ